MGQKIERITISSFYNRTVLIPTHEGGQGLEDTDGIPTPIASAPAKAVPEALAPLPNGAMGAALCVTSLTEVGFITSDKGQWL